MELVYIWVKEYKCFEKQGFNFNPKHKFKFDYDTWVLEYSKDEKVIENIFNYCNDNGEDSGIISNLTAIVGNNGAGKSTLIELIINNIASGNEGMTPETMVIFFNEGNMEIYYNYLSSFNGDYDYVFNDFKNKSTRCIKLKAEGACKEIFGDNLIDGDILVNKLNFGSINVDKKEINNPVIDKLEKINCIYHSNIFGPSYNEYRKWDKLLDISTIGLMNSDNGHQLEMHLISGINNPNVIFFHEDMYRQIKFIYDFNGSAEYIKFKLPKYARVKFTDMNTRIDGIYEMLKPATKISEENYKNLSDKEMEEEQYIRGLEYKIKVVYHNLDNFRMKKRKTKDSNKIICELYYNLLKGLFTQFLYQSIVIDRGAYKLEKCREIYKLIEEKIEGIDYLDYEEEVLSFFMKFFKEISDNENSKVMIFRDNVKYYVDLLRYFSRLSENELNKLKYNIETKEFFLEIKDDAYGLKEFYNKYKKTALSCNYLDFSWPLSSGENNYLSMFSRFYYSYYKDINPNIVDKNRDIIILIDEADLTFHPKWQQLYIKLITEYFKCVYIYCSIQLIITTHSPIILSDIPRSNIIFIKKNDDSISVEDNLKHSETFAANISTLFYDSFFMDKGSIGELAKKKINKIINALKPIVEKNVDKEELIYPNIENVLDKLGLVNLDQAIYIIDTIGEPIIKQKLKGMLNMCIDKDKEQRKIRIRNEIKQLNEQLREIDEGER
ncbi:MAG: hypothetical protein E6X81_11255 [Clostridium butyricum]|nr:hypothetical protein [Clostridium butyricum]